MVSYSSEPIHSLLTRVFESKLRVKASAMAASSCGPDSVKLYRIAVEGLELEDELIVQRRLKEAILKTSALFGVPRCLQALFPIFHSLDDDHIDTFAPR